MIGITFQGKCIHFRMLLGNVTVVHRYRRYNFEIKLAIQITIFSYQIHFETLFITYSFSELAINKEEVKEFREVKSMFNACREAEDEYFTFYFA